jgi:hypothetical protein
MPQSKQHDKDNQKKKPAKTVKVKRSRISVKTPLVPNQEFEMERMIAEIRGRAGF